MFRHALYFGLACCVHQIALCQPLHSDPLPADSGITVVFLGNSLTAGHGLRISQAFPAVLQRRVDELGWPVTMVNAEVSGETTAGGLRRLQWLSRTDIDILVVALGGNDGLRGLPVEDTQANLLSIIRMAKREQPGMQVILAGMQVPPNLGAIYTQAFREIFPEVARQTESYLIPFLLEGVGGVAALNQPDGIHPTAEGQERLADNVWAVMRGLLELLVAR
ncbi:MAG: arylesterase [Bacteroidota bacterium]|nr:arylesterase [Bacteroidota bacterium]